ncbi:MAG: hypothetical protein ACXVPU_16860 [Bacteroidia bacterium]
MKTIRMNFLIVMSAIFIAGCTDYKEKTAQELLLNQKTQNEIFDAIVHDTAYTSKLLDKMMANEDSKKIITADNSVVKMVCMSEKTDQLFNNDKDVMNKMTDRILRSMQADSAVCDKTCTKIMEDEKLKNYFRSRVNKTTKRP